MANLLDVLGQWVINHYSFRHFIVAIGILIQGEITVLIGTYLILNGYLGWGSFLISIAISIFVYEGFFYFLGRSLKGTPLGLRLEKKIPYHDKIHFHLKNHINKILILSKFISYVNVGVIFLSGWIKFNIKSFIKNRIIANTIWFSVLVTGSLFVIEGLSLLKLRQMEIAIFIIILFIFSWKHLLKKLIGKEVSIEKKVEKIGGMIEKNFQPKKD
ncbi:MAG: hypothetical protein KJI72_01865 [Patescibacteria group bacterium]|nr:hypothetical protein [Patescibacteria group bacterium]